jgi:DNA-binding GntR family transcriptional regulator
MARRGPSRTLVEDVHGRVRGDIFAGRLRPGDPLRPSTMSLQFGVSVAVVREALTRLTEQRLVQTLPQQGFFVRTLTASELTDLNFVRSHMEEFALRLAVERGDLAWETELVAVRHRLSNTPRSDPEDPSRTSEAWAELHAQFHATLIKGCEIEVLQQVCSTLYDATELYRRWSRPASDQPRDVDAEHDGIVEAVLARDAELAVQLLTAHTTRTAAILLQSDFVSPEPDNQAKQTDEASGEAKRRSRTLA